MRKETRPAPTVINRNRKGEVFNPAEYTVTREEHPEVYRLLERIAAERQGSQKSEKV